MVEEEKKTNSGIQVSCGVITASEFDVTDRDELYKWYEEMRKSDCVSSTTLDILKLPIEQADYSIVAGRKNEKAEAAREYIAWCFDQLDMDRLQRHMLLSLDYGASFFEKIYDRGVEYYTAEGKAVITNIIRKLSPFQIWTVEQFQYNEEQELDYIIQSAYDSKGVTKREEVSAEKLFWITNREEYCDVRGNSLFRPALTAFRMKKSTLESAARAISRGSGIPDITVKNSDQIAKAAKIGKTLGNYQFAFAAHTEDFKVEMLKVDGADKAVEFLDYLDRNMFFNTLSEFLSSGIGGNGSRAATEAHKTPYELAANGVLRGVERGLNRLIDEMIQISHLSNIDIKDYPTFRYDRINNRDIYQTAASISSLYQSAAIAKQEGDEEHLRQMFGLPEKIEVEATIAGKENVLGEEQKEMKLGTGRARCDEQRKIELEAKFLSGEPQQLLDTIQEEAEAIILDVKKKILKDFSKQLEKNRNASLNVRYMPELKNRLKKLYRDAFADGKAQLNSEIQKSDIKVAKFELVDSPVLGALIANIDLSVDLFGNLLKSSVEKKKNQLGANLEKQYETMDEFLSTFLDSQKMIQRDIITEVQSGYFEGRGEGMTESQLDMWVYTSVLDANLCDNCAPYNGLIYSYQEIMNDPVLQIGSPTNTTCLGGNKCRCVFVALTNENEKLGVG